MRKTAGQGCGFSDKLYWRFIAGGGFHVWHCFKKLEGPGQPLWQSLCGLHEIDRTNGQAIMRPRTEMRCGRCDGLEMERRGWEESGPATTGEV